MAFLSRSDRTHLHIIPILFCSIPSALVRMSCTLCEKVIIRSAWPQCCECFLWVRDAVRCARHQVRVGTWGSNIWPETTPRPRIYALLWLFTFHVMDICSDTLTREIVFSLATRKFTDKSINFSSSVRYLKMVHLNLLRKLCS